MATHEDDFGNGEVFRTGFESDPEEPVEDVAPANGKHGDVLSAYNVHETIGAGSFGKVKKATKRSTGEIVAIKIIDKKLIGDVEDVMRYTREFAILANLNHKNIIKLHEVTQSDIYFYVIMDLCEGNLQDIISRDGIEPPLDLMSESVDGTDLASCPKAQKKVLPEDVARGYFRQVVAGIEHSHKKNVIHRDIKLDNVLVDMDGNLRVCDFGLSAMVDDSDSMLKTQVGTLYYAAPEILKGKGYLGPPADVWSLGVLLYVMTLGRYPFNSVVKQQREIKHKIMSKSPPMPKAASRGLRDLIARMLTKDPDRRITLSQVQNHSWYLGMSIERDPPSPAYTDPSVLDDDDVVSAASLASSKHAPDKQPEMNPPIKRHPNRRASIATTAPEDWAAPNVDLAERARALRIKRHSLTNGLGGVSPMRGYSSDTPSAASAARRGSKAGSAENEEGDGKPVWERLSQPKPGRTRAPSLEARARRRSLET
mmetsp:Transcript_45914/g.107726  ORF Transcript_45914/g.107726 Transcript_45914/m.107726 type:complete len:482 (+) Transcript_45914:231-1676(+)|eukprot:CAMPEP_0177700510 /NCGR_PEP_ID=MMETSP0484_2-20121128/6131_1 /TAXON_ID=354590 /ORGANISM="Rhodomonas lens, Strain RHODO" /LENGTH=481 /DNA_ID=CAMNT_0019211711 /DNA_START=166 /DNA_END=1611 /DNA_ORIENTATION=-